LELAQPLLVKLRLEILKDEGKFFIERETTTLVKSPPSGSQGAERELTEDLKGG
jgi:hypothetical protein